MHKQSILQFNRRMMATEKEVKEQISFDKSFAEWLVNDRPTDSR